MTSSPSVDLARESVIYCEGYHDRAFWTGWLEHLGFENLKNETGRVSDPWGVRVDRGQFAFRSPSGGFVRVVPCRGKDNLIPILAVRLKGRSTRPLTHVVLCWDADIRAGQPFDPTRLRGTVEAALRKAAPGGLNEDPPDWVINDSDLPTRVSIVVWQTPEPDQPQLPPVQTLERLVCAALIDVYPERGQEVLRWLDSRTNPPPPSPKEFSWSHVAGWYAELGGEAFFTQLWKDPRIVRALESRLIEAGAWRVAGML